MSDNRDFDLVLWGATGFTGQLVTEYLADHPVGDQLDWAIAGRDREGLEKVRARLDAPHADLPILLGNAFDRASLDAIASRTDVICTTVGPYARLGSELVAACVDANTDYCDLTGEAHWVRQMIDEHHDQARDRGVRIVHCCGFDSVPSDLGVWLLQSDAIDRWGGPCPQVRCLIWNIRGGISGGTAASAAEAVAEAARNPEVGRLMADPYGLNPSDNRPDIDQPFQRTPAYEPTLDRWTAPFVMAAINEKIVRRTNALLDNRHGESFRYSEAVQTGQGLSAALRAVTMSAGLGALTAGLAIAPVRKLLERFVLPDPGEGPDEETIERGRFTMRLFGRHPNGVDRHFELVCEVGANADPGYGATAMMLAESALCLSLDDPEEGLNGGVLTPASAFGSALITRLRDAGMTFEMIQ